MPQPAGEEPDVAAANALMAAEPAPVAADTIVSVLLLGANGMLGPPVVNELGDHYSLSVTDINPYGWRQGGDEIVAGTGEREDIELVKPLSDFAKPCEDSLVDVADAAAVAAATAGVDATVNCAVLRPHPKLAFDVNTTGTYNAIKSAVENGHSRFINTGPHFTVTGFTCKTDTLSLDAHACLYLSASTTLNFGQTRTTTMTSPSPWPPTRASASTPSPRASARRSAACSQRTIRSTYSSASSSRSPRATSRTPSDKGPTPSPSPSRT